jgi:hypothetical protein
MNWRSSWATWGSENLSSRVSWSCTYIASTKRQKTFQQKQWISEGDRKGVNIEMGPDEIIWTDFFWEGTMQNRSLTRCYGSGIDLEKGRKRNKPWSWYPSWFGRRHCCRPTDHRSVEEDCRAPRRSWSWAAAAGHGRQTDGRLTGSSGATTATPWFAKREVRGLRFDSAAYLSPPPSMQGCWAAAEHVILTETEHARCGVGRTERSPAGEGIIESVDGLVAFGVWSLDRTGCVVIRRRTFLNRPVARAVRVSTSSRGFSAWPCLLPFMGARVRQNSWSAIWLHFS